MGRASRQKWTKRAKRYLVFRRWPKTQQKADWLGNLFGPHPRFQQALARERKT